MRDPLSAHTTVAVLGLGAAGRAACRLLDRLGKRVVASDANMGAAPELPTSVEVRLGGNDIGDATAAVLSPGLNPEWPENRDNPALRPLWDAVRAGAVELWSEVELAIAAADLPTITIGGTDGKSTTAAMTRDLVAAAGPRVAFGGNSWTALSDVVLDSPGAESCVAEVSAFQTWAGHRLKPDVAVLTNIAPDHLDHYADEAAYVRAKLRVLEHLGPGDAAVLNAGDARLAAAREGLAARGVVTCGYALDAPDEAWNRRAWVDGGDLRVEDEHGAFRVPLSAVPVPGSHNRRNALAALLAARALGVSRDLDASTAARALGAFRGLPHRLEPVRELDGVLWLDDSKATNIHAAVTGLTSLDRPVVAIVGGVDKQLDLAPLLDALDRGARHVVVIGQLAGRFAAEAGSRRWSISRAESMEGAVTRARELAGPGDAVVLAPACSSFDMFRSFEQRGQVYQAAVRALPPR